MKERNWKKYMDRAFAECDNKTLDMLEKLHPSVSALMLIQMGKDLCQNDEWKKIVKQLKPKFWEFWKK